MSYGFFVRGCPCVGLLTAVVSVFLVGCSDGATTLAQSTPTAKAMFAQFEHHQNSPKSALTTALKTHLTNEQVAVVDYYRQTSPKPVSPLDKNSDSLLQTIIKTDEYKSNKNQTTGAYRTHDEYFAKDALYLRYYDEKDGTVPQKNYDLSRSAGIENAVQYGDKQVKYFAERYKGCVTTIAHDVDALVKGNPTIDISHPRLKNRLSHLDDCLQKSDKTFVSVFDNPTVYQALDLDYIKGCASRYRQNLSDALAKKRTIVHYEGEAYDVYESVYGNFAVCYAGFEMGYRLDPAYYTEMAYSQAHLEQLHQNRLCALKNRDEQQTLSQTAQNYATDPKAYATAFYRYFECLDKAMLGTDGEREPVLPTSFDSAQAQYELYKEWLDFNAGNDEDE